jgi:hypothetical protein
MIRDDDRCHACHLRPARHEDLCDVCEGDAQRSDREQLAVDLDRLLIDHERTAA